jgi:hypothetical protein
VRYDFSAFYQLSLTHYCGLRSQCFEKHPPRPQIEIAFDLRVRGETHPAPAVPLG